MSGSRRSLRDSELDAYVTRKMDVELNNLTEAERDAITSVLRRDEELRKREMDRIRKLRTDVKRIRMKGVIKAGHDPMKTCARCREPFGWLFNKGSVCPKCQHKVCDKCRHTLSKVSNSWVCVLCFKQKELDAQTNKWFYSQFRKSKRNKKTNNVITGPEIVRASIRRAHRDAASGSGSDGGRSSIGDEIKRVLSNNNASPKSRRTTSQSTSGGQDEPGESSDTQSMGTASSPRHRKHNHHPRDISDVTYPKDSDRQKLFDLIRPKSVDEVDASPQHQVKKVVNKKYSDSESSSSGSEPSSPNISTRPDSSFGYSDSVRSSIRSSSAVSSDGRMTIVTESCISDIDTVSLMSEIPQETPVMVPRPNQDKVTTANHMSSNTSIHSGGGRSSSEVTNLPPRSASNTFKSSDSVIDHPSHSSQILNSNSTLDDYEPAETVVVHKVINNRRQDSLSSDSEDDFTTEQITKVKFRRVSKKGQRSRSPSPETRKGQSSNKTSTPREEVVGGRGRKEVQAAGAAAAGRNKEERSRGIAGAAADRTNTTSSKVAHVHTAASLKHANGGTTDKASSATAVVGAAAASSVLAPASGGTYEDYLSSDNSDEEMGAAGWQDDDPIRSKVGSLLAKYGRMEGVQATSYSKEAAKAPEPERKYEPHNIIKSRALPDDTHVTFKQNGSMQSAGFDDDEYVIIDGMDVQDTSTETSVEPQSGSEGARSVSDINDDSFEDLEWDGDIMAGVRTESMDMDASDEVDNAMLMNELRAAVAASLASAEMEDEGRSRHSPPPSRSHESHKHAAPSSVTNRLKNIKSQDDEDVFDDEKQVNYEFQSYTDENAFSRIGRYPRMFPLQDDECSDSLSIITELTEPDNESGRLSSRSSTPTTDSRRSYSRSSTPIQKPRSSTPSTIEELDTEDEILARPPSQYQDSNKTVEKKRSTEVVKSTKMGMGVTAMEVDSSENNSPRPDSVESDHSFSQTSECSATESAQEGHQPSAPSNSHAPKRLIIDERRDSFDVLAESSLQVSASVDFAEVYEANKKYVDATECDFNENDIRINTIATGKIKPEKPQRSKNSAKERAKAETKSTVQFKKKTAGNLAKEASEVVKRTKKAKEEDSEMRRQKSDTLKVGQVEMRKKKSEGNESSRDKTRERKTEKEADELANSYKEMRKSLTHVERNEETVEKRRKMSDGLVVDSTPMASLTKLTKMFDVAPAYMRAGSPRPSEDDKRASTSSSSSGEQPMEAGEEQVGNTEYTVVSYDEQAVMMRKGRQNRECYVMDTDDAGPINLADLGSNDDMYDSDSNKESERTESLNAMSCPSHSSFNEGLEPQKDSPTLTSSLKPSKSSGEPQPRSSKTVTIKLNDEEIGESSTDDLLDDSAIEHISQGDNKVLEVIIPDGHSGDEKEVEEHFEEDRAAVTQSEQSHYYSIAEQDKSEHRYAEASSMYYTANSETPLQIKRINRHSDHYDENRNFSRLSEPREASILDDDDDDDDEYLDERDHSGPDSTGEVSGESTGRYNTGYGRTEQPLVVGYGNASHDLYYAGRGYGDGALEGYAYAQTHSHQGLDTISEGESELTHDLQTSGTVSRTSWTSSDYSVDNSVEYPSYKNRVQFRGASRSENDRSWSNTSRSGSEESVQSNSSHQSEDGYSSNDWDRSKSDNRKSCVSFDSLDVYLDVDSDTAEERAHPEKLEEDFALSLDLGPRLDPNHNYSSTPLKRGLRETVDVNNENSDSRGQLALPKLPRGNAAASLHDSVVLSEQSKQDLESDRKLHHSKNNKQSADSTRLLSLPKHPAGSASALLRDTVSGTNEGNQGRETDGATGKSHHEQDTNEQLALPKHSHGAGASSHKAKEVTQSTDSSSGQPPNKISTSRNVDSKGGSQVNKKLDSRKLLALPKHPSGSASSLLHDISDSNFSHTHVPSEHTSSFSHPTDSSPVPAPTIPTEAGDSYFPSKYPDKQSGGAAKVVQKQQKVHLEQEQKQQQQKPGENQHLLGGDKISQPVREYGDSIGYEGQPDTEAKLGPSSDSDYKTSESPVHTDDANIKPEVPSVVAVQVDERFAHLSRDDEPQYPQSGSSAAAPSGGDHDDVIKIDATVVTSSPKHQQQVADDDLEEEINVDDDELENIDDIVASVKSTPTRSTRSTAPVTRSTGNLLSSFSASKESIASYYSDAGEGNYGNVAVTGEMQFGLDYNYKTGSLEIAIKQCRDLAAVDKKKNRSDPYVKTYLLPDKTKSGKRKTRAKKHTLSPTFDELLKYQITKSELETRTLWISVWNNDTFGRNDFLGEVSIPLDYYAFDDPSPQWYKLQDRGIRLKTRSFSKELPMPSYQSGQGSPPPKASALKHPESSPPGSLTKQKSKSVSFLDSPHLPKLVGNPLQEWSSSTNPFSPDTKSPKGKKKSKSNSSSMALITYKGDLIILLKYVTSDNVSSKKTKGGGKSRGELHVLVKEARNLTAVRSNGTSDPFCKGYLLPEKTRGTKQKTPVVKRNVNPQWNHTFIFEDVSLDDLRERSIELTIWDHDRFTSNDFLGGVRLNLGTGRCGGKEVDWMDARGEEISIWQNMCDRPNTWSEASLMLRHTMAKRM